MGVLLAGLVACATPPASAPQDNFWSGRLALNVAAEPPQAMSAGFELRGDARAGELALLSPLGQTMAVARWSPAGATLQQGERSLPYASMDELTEQLTGAALPLPALFGWLRGEPAEVPGWSADLSGHADGRILAQRQSPPPRAELRIRLQP
jgi:outer membrane lipoprotein LolB